jgi:hypothetical protein
VDGLIYASSMVMLDSARRKVPVPSVRMIHARLHVGQPRAQRVRAYLTALSNP